MTKQVYIDFKSNRNYGFKNQIQRCSVSVMNNIAEGFCKKSDKEFYQFLNISKVLCDELKSLYYKAEDIEYISPEIAKERRLTASKTMNGINKLMVYLRSTY